MRSHNVSGIAAILACALIGFARGAEEAAPQLERFSIDESGRKHIVEGRVLTEAADGGLLVVARDGRLWTAPPDRLESRESLERPFTPLAGEELAAALVAELGGGYACLQTEHYVICTDAGDEYAQWCGRLFERLLAAFAGYWRERGVELSRPEFPLPVIVFRSRERYADYARRELGAEADTASAYYSVRTNRIILSDLAEGQSMAQGLVLTLRRKQANVATTVHEAIHQIAFNTGFHTRYADNPMWLTEGLAIYFETPDFDSSSGWRTAGIVHRERLRRFRDFAGERRQMNSLESLIRNDDRLREPARAADAYAEAWALTYFLVKRRPEQYARYVVALQQRPRLVWSMPDERLALFRECFGDLAEVERDFRRAIGRLQ